MKYNFDTIKQKICHAVCYYDCYGVFWLHLFVVFYYVELIYQRNVRIGGYVVFIHPTSDVQSSMIGDDSRIWQFSVVMKGAVIGDNCNICSHTYLEDGAVVGNNVTIKSGVYLWGGVCLEDDVFVGPCVVFCNDKYPRSKVYHDEYLKTVIGKGASLGANSTILPGIRIGVGAMIGAGSVVTKDVPDNAVVYGNPARVVRYF